MERWFNAVASKVALLLKTREDGTTKVRLIINLRRSGRNGGVELPERVVLPRLSDLTNSILDLMVYNSETMEVQQGESIGLRLVGCRFRRCDSRAGPWPFVHTNAVQFSGDFVVVDMRFVCPKGVRNMLVQRARSVHWKKWAAKHEYEELKEGAWLEPGLALLREKVKENWTEKHRYVARKIFLEGGWTQKRLFDIGWSDVSHCEACKIDEGTEKHRLYHCPEWYEGREIPEAFRKLEQKA